MLHKKVVIRSDTCVTCFLNLLFQMEGTASPGSQRSRSLTDAFRQMSQKITRRSTRTDMTESEIRTTSGEATCDNDVFVTEHAEQDDPKTEEGVVGDSNV